MKNGIHPDYKDCEVKCACGNTFVTKSIKEELKLEICSECHPFFTGTQKTASRGGRIEKFNKKYNVQEGK